MLILSLSLALLLQGAPVHADLHPKNADVYLELGDSAVLWPALEQSSMARFLRDEKMKALFSALGQSVEGNLQGQLLGLLQKTQPDWKAETWLSGLERLSISGLVLGPETETRAGKATLLVADFATPEQAAAFAGVIGAQAKKAEPHTLPGVQRLSGDKASEEQWSITEGKRFVLGNSGSLPEDHLARAGKMAEGIAGSELFQKFAQLEPAKGGVLAWLLVARPLVEMMKAGSDSSGAAKILEQLPADLNPFASPKVARLQVVGGRYVTEMLAPRMPGDSDRTVDAAWLDAVPGEAMLVYSTPFDAVAAGKTVRAMLAQSEESAATLAAVEQKLGFGLERVFSHLGPGLTMYMGPLASLGLPEARAYVDCADPAAFTQDIVALATALAESLPGVGAKTKGYKVKQAGAEEKVEVPVTTISLPPEFSQNPMISISPSFAPLGKKLVFALNSMDVKNELKRVLGGEAAAAGSNPVAKAGFQVPAGAQSVVMMDWAKLLSGVIGMAKAFLPMSGMQVPFDMNNLPTGDELAAYFPPTFHHARLTEHGVYRRNEGSFGPETWLGILGGAFAARSMAPTQLGAPEDAGAAPISAEPEPVPLEPK